MCDTQADTWENAVLKEGAKILEKIGGAEGDRTLGLMTASHALSQLSYSPTWVLVYQTTVIVNKRAANGCTT